MTQPVTALPLAKYAKSYEAVECSKRMHFLAVIVTAFAISIIGFLAAMALAKGLLPLDLGVGASIAVSATSAVLIFTIAVIGILLHYICTIVAKKREATQEKFLEALSEPITDANKAVWARTWDSFSKMIKNHFTDSHWKSTLRYIDDQIFEKPQSRYSLKSMNQIYYLLFRVDPIAFLKNHLELKADKLLVNREGVNDIIDHVLKETAPEDWAEIINSIKPKDALTFMPIFEKPSFLRYLATADAKIWAKFILLIDHAYFQRESSAEAENKILCKEGILRGMRDENADTFLQAYMLARPQLSRWLRIHFDETLTECVATTLTQKRTAEIADRANRIEKANGAKKDKLIKKNERAKKKTNAYEFSKQLHEKISLDLIWLYAREKSNLPPELSSFLKTEIHKYLSTRNHWAKFIEFCLTKKLHMKEVPADPMEIVKIYYREKSHLPSEFNNLLKPVIEKYLDGLTDMDWAELIKCYDTKIAQELMRVQTPKNLIKKMCDMNRIKFDSVVGMGVYKKGSNAYQKIKDMDPSKLSWLLDLRTAQIGIEEGRLHPYD